MNKVLFSKDERIRAQHLSSSKNGELVLNERHTIRGKGQHEKRSEQFQAIFTFDDPIVCQEAEVPVNGGYYFLENNLAEVTQIIGRFDTYAEREEWLLKTFSMSLSD